MSARALRVLVAADQALVAEVMVAALASRGLDPVRLGTDTVPAEADVGLLLTGLESALALHQARQVLARAPSCWVLATSSPPGVVWGAALDAGACVVVPTWISLGQLLTALQDASTGLLSPAGAERQQLISRWVDPEPEGGHEAECVRSLSSREHEVLRLLVVGETVLQVAALLDITEGTVRAHVKAMLRKLGVSSQLAAVALYRRVGAAEGWPPQSRGGRGRPRH